MDAVICQRGELRVEDRPEPVPGKGQVRLEVIRCGICGSDLHARHGMDQWADLAEPVGYDGFGRSEQPSSSGTSSPARSPSTGPAAAKSSPRARRVVALPLLRGSHGVDMTGLSAARARRLRPAGARRGVADDGGAQRSRPRGRRAHRADGGRLARRAPRRGRQARRGDRHRLRAGRPRGDPVLKAQGVRTVVASDRSPGRRALAQACGADVVVDPTKDSPYEAVDAQGAR